MFLGCIGDDFTGSSDLANTLARGGMRVVQFNGVPRSPAGAGVEAGVVALKTRTAPVSDAVAQSLAALDWLRAQGCRQILLKYCSTFDSTPEGNIGPVLDALSGALGAAHVVVCPAFPATGRSVYQGHLFVGDRLLNESGMQDHPLTPMTDPDLRRWLGRQTRAGVGHVGFGTVAQGPAAIAAGIAAVAGARYIVVDAIRDADLVAIGEAAAAHVLLSGGSGIALGLPGNFRRAGLIGQAAPDWAGGGGPVAALCGSCSSMTRRQIADHAARHPAREVTADKILAGAADPGAVADWVMGAQGAGVPLVYSSADPAAVAAAQAAHGRDRVAVAVEGFFAALAQALARAGVARMIVAGGETSGAVVSALGIEAFAIGPEIDPGVPALRAEGTGIVLALKSGNFGAVDFFAKAARVLAGEGAA